MKRSFGIGLCAVAAVALLASVTGGATIQEVLAHPFDPTVGNFDDYFTFYFGTTPAIYWLTWDPALDPNHYAPGGHSPPGAPEYGPPGGNPAWLRFNDVSTSGPGHLGNTVSTFKLGNKDGGTWGMRFSVLLYDASFAGDAISISLLGNDPNDPQNYRQQTIEAAQVISGIMLNWRLDADEGEDVTVYIESQGDESYAAGFFMTGEYHNHAPEPATMALVAAGLACLVARRRQR